MLVDSNTWKEEAKASYLLWQKDYPVLTEEVERLTTILQADIYNIGVSLAAALADLSEAWSMYLPLVDYVVAYNKDYDEVMFRAEAKRQQSSSLAQDYFLSRPWLCAMRDVKENLQYKCLKLSHLALDHGIPVDPNVLHRALADVELTHKMLAKLGRTAQDIHTYQSLPSVVVQALIPAPFQDGGKGKSLAVKRGYSWEVPRGTQEK
jgi:DNA polymerase III epsilon subunit-like protein